MFSKENILSQYKYISYLIGSMEVCAEGDDGSSKRTIIERELLARGVFAINPVTLEKSKTGMTTDNAKQFMTDCINKQDYSTFKKLSKEIWKGIDKYDVKHGLIHVPGDIDYVTMSTFITCLYQEGDQPCVEQNTMVLMGDGSTKKIKDLKINDIIYGVVRRENKTRIEKTKVLAVYNKGKKECINIEDTIGNKLTLTKDHGVLTRNKKRGSVYLNASEVKDCFSLKVSNKNKKLFIKGWIAGYFKHDGNFSESYTSHLATALSDKKEEMEVVSKILDSLEIKNNLRKITRRNADYYIVSVGEKISYWKLKDLVINNANNKLFKLGWLSGSIDADGWYDKESIRYSQSTVHKININAFKRYCSDVGIKYSYGQRVRKQNAIIEGRTLNSNGNEVTFVIPKSFAFYIPSLLEYKRNKLSLTINTLSSKVNISDDKKRTVYDIVTESGNFIANGIIVHNCGTFFELGIALEHDIPVYLLTDCPIEKLKKSFLQGIFASGGLVFNDIGTYLNFLENEYKLTRQEKK